MFEELFGEFWGKIWSTFIHILGLAGVAAFSAFLAWGLINDAKRPSVSSTTAFTTTESAMQDLEAIQAIFRRLLLAAEKPCAKKGKQFSDVSGCTLFGLKLGMTADDAEKIVNGSGFARSRIKTSERCYENGTCEPAIHIHTDTFSLDAAFDVSGTNNVTTIRLMYFVLGAGGNPYFDAEIARLGFYKTFGDKDRSLHGHDYWGDSQKDFSDEIDAYTYAEQVWIFFRRKLPTKQSDSKPRVPA